jgi:hypothetical protein
MLKNFEKVKNHIENDIGIFLSEDQIVNLKIHHNYSEKNVEHVWPF